MRKAQPKMSESHGNSPTMKEVNEDRRASPVKRREWLFAPNISVLYCVNPKAGCTSLRHLLGYVNAKFRHQRRFFLPGVPEHLLRFAVPDTVKGYATLYRQIADNEEHFRMTFVRNPYARALSAYLNIARKRDGSIGFEDFVNSISKENPYGMNVHWMPQTLNTGIRNVDYSFIGRLENFEEDTRFLFGDEALGPVNKGTGRRHATNALQKTMEFYTPGLTDKVYEIYREDFELFGYSKKLEDASSWEPSHKLPRAVLHPKSCSPLTRFLITILHDPPPPLFQGEPTGLARTYKRSWGLLRYPRVIRLLQRLLAAGT